MFTGYNYFKKIYQSSEQKMQPPIVAPGIVYPNPSSDGQFKVLLSEDVEGEVTYGLFSLSGSELTKGKLTLIKPTSILEFNFSQQTRKEGMYYLQLKNKKGSSVFKLIRIN
jgi:hypothetical protein